MEHKVNGELIPQGGGDTIALARSPLTLGRRESCDICLQFPNVSGRHCELTFKEGLWILRDLDSKNGTKLNGTRMDSGAKKIVHSGDVISIGKRNFQLDYNETGRASETEEFDDEVVNITKKSLLEKAGLAKPQRTPGKPKIDLSMPTPVFDTDDDEDDDD